MRIVIPSYNRYESINDKSLKVLDEAGYPANQIDLFVANQDQSNKYKEVVNPEINIIIGLKGLREIRDFIFDYYEEGTHLLCLDDDIEVIRKIEVPAGPLVKETNIKSLVERGFDECKKNNLKLWGLYPCPNNPFYMDRMPEMTTNYKFIIGNFFGCIHCKDMNLLSVLDADDYERSIRSYLRYGGSIRFNHHAAKTKFLKNKGGAQDNKDRLLHLAESHESLMNTYPKLLYRKKRKAKGRDLPFYPILKDQREKKTSV